MIICLIKSRSNSGRKFITRGGVNNGSATYHQNPNLIVDVGSNKDASPCSIHLPSAVRSTDSSTFTRLCAFEIVLNPGSRFGGAFSSEML